MAEQRSQGIVASSRHCIPPREPTIQPCSTVPERETSSLWGTWLTSKTVSSRVESVSTDGNSTTSLCNPFHCLTTLTGKMLLGAFSESLSERQYSIFILFL